MNDLLIVALFSLAGGIISLSGGLLLMASKKHSRALVTYITPFAGGALLAAAFLDILTEAEHAGYIEQALQWTLIGIVLFLLFERFLRWFHSRSGKESDKSTAPLIIVSDTIHNFLDGIAIAAAFLIDIPTGIITTVAVAAHEIPQEIGDFGLLLQKGLSRKKVILANAISALATTFAAVVFFQLGSAVNVSSGIALGLVAGFFIYIAVSDIIPSIHKNENHKVATLQTFFLIVGVIAVGWATTNIHQFIDHDVDEHEESAFVINVTDRLV